jgi:hypothetical protein
MEDAFTIKYDKLGVNAFHINPQSTMHSQLNMTDLPCMRCLLFPIEDAFTSGLTNLSCMHTIC